MNFLISPYAFKGTLSASEAAEAIAQGVRRFDERIGCRLLPLGDGGSGTLDALVAGLGGEYRKVRCPDAVGRVRECRWGMVSGGRGVVEGAEVIPLAGVPENLRDPALLSTAGLGELIVAALSSLLEHPSESSTEIIIGLGDTATHDCGLGVGRRLGYRFLDRHGKELAPLGRSLPYLAAIDPAGAPELPGYLRRTVFCDVLNPLCGPDGAARRFAPQKGANGVTVELLEEGSLRFAELVERDLGVKVKDIPGAGAAGGLGAGLAAFLGADLAGGAEGVLQAARFDAAATACDLIITGEGKLDAKTLLGKGVAHIAERGRRHGIKTMIVAGSMEGTIPDWQEKLNATIVVPGGDVTHAHQHHRLTEAVLEALSAQIFS